MSVPVDIHRIIFEVVNILKHSINRKISIEQNLSANPVTTHGDPSQIQSAVLNIALNARDAMPAGGSMIFSTEIIEIKSKLSNLFHFDVEPGKYIELCIKDTGCGMDKVTQNHIFEPFFTTKEIGKGTGMGLAAVYGTVKSHKGAIDIKSKTGKGTQFFIYLPLYIEKGIEDNNIHEEEKTEKEPHKILGKIGDKGIINDESIQISATCTRVPVVDGHTACVNMKFKDKVPTKEEILKIFEF